MKTIVGLFDSYHEAESTVADLERAGYSRNRISVVAGKAAGDEASADVVRSTGAPVPSETRSQSHSESVAEGAGTGAVIGGVTGGAAGLIASLAGLAIPGIGPVLAVGPIVAM